VEAKRIKMPQWFALKMPCPIKTCPNSKDVILNWVCKDDGTGMFISEEGRLSCTASGANHNDKVINWKLDCGDQSESGPHRSTRFLSPDFEGFNHALSIALCHSTAAGSEWVIKLIKELDKQYERN